MTPEEMTAEFLALRNMKSGFRAWLLEFLKTKEENSNPWRMAKRSICLLAGRCESCMDVKEPDSDERGEFICRECIEFHKDRWLRTHTMYHP